MPIQIHIAKKESTDIRLKMLPRMGACIDLMGYQLDIRSAPLLETLMAFKKRDFSLQSLFEVGIEQLNQIQLGELDENCGGACDEQKA